MKGLYLGLHKQCIFMMQSLLSKIFSSSTLESKLVEVQHHFLSLKSCGKTEGLWGEKGLI